MQKLEFNAGEQYGKWTFIGPTTSVSNDGHVYGLWKCGYCTNISLKENRRIKSLQIKSCGCKGTYNIAKKKKHANPDYCWEIVYTRLILRTIKKRKINCEITPDYLKHVYQKQNGKCAYTGQLIVPPTRFTELTHPEILSVDRIDSSKGYVEGNIQFVTKKINFMKQSLSHDEFVNLCQTVCHHLVQLQLSMTL